MLRKRLSQLLDRDFTVDRNSFASCVYFNEPEDDSRMTLRIKVYNKTLAWLQSRTSMMPLGMNTTKMFNSKGTLKSILKESQETGLFRIEVSYKFSKCI